MNSIQSPFTSLRYGGYRLLWISTTTESLGRIMELAAVLWLAYELTESPLMVSVVGSCMFIPRVFAFLGGAVADRVSRRNLLITSLLISGLLSVSLIVLITTDMLEVWHLIAFALLRGIAGNFTQPARQSIIPSLVSRVHLLNALTLNTISVWGSRLVSMAIAGYLIGVAGVAPVFMIRVAGILITVLLLLFIDVSRPDAKIRSFRGDIADVKSYLAGHRLILILILIFILPQLSRRTYVNLMPVFATEVFRSGATGYGFLQAAPSLGGLISLIALASLGDFRHKGLLLLVTGAMMSIGLIAFSASPWLYLSLALLLIVGGMEGLFRPLNNALIQSTIPDEIRGKVMGLRQTTLAFGPVASIGIGAVAEYTGVSFALGMLGGFCFIIFASLTALLPQLRQQ